MADQPRVVTATPMQPTHVARLRQEIPGVDVLHDAELLPPMRWPADFAGDPAFSRSPAQQARFEELLNSADILYGIPDINPQLLTRTIRANPRLRWVQCMAAGAGAQVKEAGLNDDELSRVAFTTGAGVHAGPLAEFALLGLLAGLKNVDRLQELAGRREWSGRWPMRQLADSTVVVVGLGGIGREVVRMVQALGARVIGVNRSPARDLEIERVVPTSELVNVIGEADCLVSTLPGTTATAGVISAEVLAAATPGLVVASVGRGTVFDESALIEALRNGTVAFAAMDVFAVEPLPTDSPLWELPNVLISPHTAANSTAEEGRLVELFIDNAHRFLAGQELRNRVNTVEFY